MAQVLETLIKINAKTGNGFSEVGSTLQNLGNLVNQISVPLLEFGKDAADVYRQYEKSMTDAEIALSTRYGRGTAELRSTMDKLDVAATEWAATSIFHTNDVANAISEAAHAGWSYEEIMSGIPAAMELASAGGLDLSESVNYIVKSTNAMGLSFDDVGRFIDHWAFAANSSATNINEMGDAMLRMGSTMKFSGGMDQTLTMLATLANVGYTGSEAGTLMRNSMLRLLAPTAKASEVIDELGATSEEYEEIMNDVALQEANARLQAAGFSAYDDKGHLKSMLDTYRELYVALGNIAGGYEDLDQNQDVIQTLSAIFPTRSLTGALAMLQAAGEGYGGLFEQMQSGAAEGYGAYAASENIDTLNGSIEIFNSKVERLKELVGAELSDDIRDFLGSMGGFVDKISGLDAGPFSALVDSLKVIAVAGPGLLIGGQAIGFIGRTLSVLTTTPGQLVLAAIAITAISEAFSDLAAADVASDFGLGNIDHAAVQNQLSQISEDFNSAYDDVYKFADALQASVESYTQASETFSSNLLKDVLDGGKISGTELKEYETLGATMYASIQKGINASAEQGVAYWSTLLGDSPDDIDPAHQWIYDTLGNARDAALEEAEGINTKIHDKLMECFRNGVTPEDYSDILNYFQEYNRLVAEAEKEAAEEQDYVDRARLMHKAQTASLEEIDKTREEITDARDAKLEEFENMYIGERASLEYKARKAMEGGNGYDYNNDGVIDIANDAELQTYLSQLDTAFEGEQERRSAGYDKILHDLDETGITQSDLGDTYEGLKEVVKNAASPLLAAEEFAGDFANRGDLIGVHDFLEKNVSAMGGEEAYAEKVEYHEGIGNTAFANDVQAMLDAYGASGVMLGMGTAEGYDASGLQSVADAASVIAGLSGNAGEQARGFVESLRDLSENGSLGEVNDMFSSLSAGTQDLLRSTAGQIGSMYDVGRFAAENNIGSASGSDVFSALLLSQSENAEDYRISVTGEVTEIVNEADDLPPIEAEAVIESIDQGAAENLSVPVDIQPRNPDFDIVSDLQMQGVEVNVDGDTQQLSATIDAQNGKTLMSYVDGDATNLEMSITAQDGKTLTEHVTGDASSLAAVINSYNGRTITVNIVGKKMFAAGGRATEASIFGEAGPEWAIPEEHTQRTAELLDAARAASGFTWPDLLSRLGGMNANPGNIPSTIIYSPTINANDATGVDEVLRQDKYRLERWFENRQLMQSVEVYA